MEVAAFVEQVHAAEVVGRLRHTDAEVVEALLDPANFERSGRLNVRAVARATGRNTDQVERALATLRREARR